MSSPLERDFAHIGGATCSFRADAIKNSAEQRRLYETAANVVTPEQMPMENSPEGLIKHLVNERMTTKECCVDAYMQFLPPDGRSGRHRHMWEEVLFVVEGSGYDLHWDVRFDCNHEMEFSWEEEPKRFEWSQGDFVYIPPYCTHKHFNSDPKHEARIIVINSRIVKAMGFNWFEQIENAEGY